MVGIFGTEEGIYNEPDGVFLPAPKPRCYELLVKKGGDKIGLPVIPSRLSILTKPLNGRASCHYCGQCGRGCATHSNFSSTSVLLPPAMATGNLEIVPGAMVREVITNGDGKATGVSYVDTNTRQEYTVNAKVVVLAASACSTARIMLNSKSSTHPNGLSNSSDTLGRYLMDSTGASVGGFFPQMVDMPAHNEDGVGGMHVYVPWWLNNKKLPFSRGYHIEVWGGRGMPGYGFGWGIDSTNGLAAEHRGEARPKGGGGYGAQLKQDYRSLYGTSIGFSGRGEMIARRENHCSIDPTVVDQYGIPVLRFDVRWSDDEILQIKHFHETGRELIEAMGGVATSNMPGPETGYGILAPGRIIHEVGVARMGDDPRTSVVNSMCQAHEIDNLFVADAASFVSQADKNPTWTIMALSMRTSEHIIEEMTARNL